MKKILCTSAILLATSVAMFAAGPPNIVLILVDDLGYADLGCYGSDLYQTPHIDRLAQEGMRFTDAYAACTVCSPTRASILTGKYPARLRITDWLTGHKRIWEKLALPEWNRKGLPKEEVTVAELLGANGYRCAAPGKWHLGSVQPTEQGFLLGKENWEPNTSKDPSDPKGVFALTRQALDFIDADPDTPFFIYLSHYSVHSPVRFDPDVKQKYEERIRPGMRQTDAGYAAMVEALDDSVGMLLEGLEERGLDRTTLVLFYSDNGGFSHFTNNAPLREGKGTQYEGGLRVPLIARWTGTIEPGSESAGLVSSVDLLPTFCELAGVGELPDNMDGRSLTRTLAGEEEDRSRSLFWHYPHYHIGEPASVIRKGRYKLIQFLDGMDCELYDLDADIGETRDLAEQKPEIVSVMLEELDQWRESVDAQMMEPNPYFDPAKVGQKARKWRE